MKKENKDNFILLSDAFLNYWRVYIKFYYYWNEITKEEIANYFIIDAILSSFLAEIGIKTLITYESNKICKGHKLDKLFLKLHPQTQEVIASNMGYKLEELLNKLKENNNHFISWRYYFESQCKTFNVKFMETLLNSILTIITYLRQNPLKVTKSNF